MVVTAIGVHPIGSAARPSDRAPNGRYRVDQGDQLGDVVTIATRDRVGERDARGIDEEMVLGTRSASVHRARARFGALFLAYHEAREQLAGDGRVLGRAVPEPEQELHAVGVIPSATTQRRPFSSISSSISTARRTSSSGGRHSPQHRYVVSTSISSMRNGTLLRFSPVTLAMGALLLASCGGATAHTVSTPKAIPVPPAAKYGGPTNIIPNPSFEKNARYWEPWGPSRLVRNTRVKRFGTASGQVTATSALPFGVRDVNVVGYPSKGHRFTLSVWVKGFPSTARKGIILELSESGGPAKEPTRITALTTGKLTGKWQQLHATGTVKQDLRSSLNVLIYISNDIAITDGFYVDGATLYLK